MQCEKCGNVIDPEDTYERAGKRMCEDCYLDMMSQPKLCDPWAVYAAKKSAEHNLSLTPLQEHLLSLLKEKGPLTEREICKALEISADEFLTNFATLRHMELARAFKKNDQVFFTLFNEQGPPAARRRNPEKQRKPYIRLSGS